MIETLRSGGVLMVPIAACSILSVAVIIDRLWHMRKDAIISPEIIGQVNHWVGEGLPEEAMTLCRRVDSPMSRIFMSSLGAAGSSRAEMRLIVEDAGRREASALEKNLNWLTICATVSPLLGLLGTVTGMIKVFRSVALEGPGNPFALASGISEALVTTAAGLVVAIPALLFYYYFSGKVDSIVEEMELRSMQMVNVLADRQPGEGRGRR